MCNLILVIIIHFFHRYASYRKNINTIWDIKSTKGVWVSSQKDMEKVEVEFYSNHFKESGLSNIVNQMKVVSHYPYFFTREEGL